MSKRNYVSPLVQWINSHVWLEGCDLETELLQAEDEGRELATVRAEFDRLLAAKPPLSAWLMRLGQERDETWLAAAAALVDKVQTLPTRADYAYVEPSDLRAIQKARRRGPGLPKWNASKREFLRRLHGGWLGRICGCMLGKPVESWRRQDIQVTLEATGSWPLATYVPRPTKAQQKRIAAAGVTRIFPESYGSMLRGSIDGMVEDDDTNYTTTGFALVQQRGADFTPLDVCDFWGQNIPIFHTCTSERVAYRNFVSLVLPPASATYRNPYRESVGAQIRADYFGYANPGDPVRAAEWAWRDACISHVRNGIYGEMWVAAMLAAAYVEEDIPTIIRAGLAQVPARSRLARDVERILAARQAGATDAEVVERIHQQWDENKLYHWCHTNSNAQIVAAALLFGGHDFGQTIALAVMPGFDTDCNGATVGSVWGVVHGVGALPRSWTAPIRDKIRTGVAGYHEVKVSAMAAEMVDVALKNKAQA